MNVRELFVKTVHGGLGGIAGGLLFGPIMAVTGILPLVARLIGQQEEWIGFSVHMGISLLFGTWFGLIFAFADVIKGNLMKATVWGVVYGFVWWILGGLTLMPAFLGMPPQFSNASSTMNLASLAGHLIYGLALGPVHGYLGKIGFLTGRAGPASAAVPSHMIRARPP